MKVSKFLLIVYLISSVHSNPIIQTFINEFQTAPDSLERIELHAVPPYGQVDLGGWTITTRAGTATINPGTILPLYGYATIDRTNTAGIFSLDETQDTIYLYTNHGWRIDEVRWPSLPVGNYNSPAPPYDGSSSRYRPPYEPWEPINWYIDSTPTFDEPNDDWSSISGRVLNQYNQPLIGFGVYARGFYGRSAGKADSLGDYTVAGLGEGNYWLFGYDSLGQRVNYPESVFVGYNQHITGIHIIVPDNGMERTDPLVDIGTLLSIPNPILSNSTIYLNLPNKTKVVMKVFDAGGNLLQTLMNQNLKAGKHKISLEPNLPPSIYFLNISIGKQRVNKKIIYLK